VGFLVVLVVAVALMHWWDRRRVREAFEAYGHTVEKVRWVPLELRLNGGRTTVFSVTYAARDGSRWRCRVEAPMFRDLELDQPVSLDPVEAAATGTNTTIVGVRAASRTGSLRHQIAATACAAVCALLMGATYWTAPARQLDLPTSLLTPALLGVVAAAAALRARFRERPMTTFAFLSGSVVFVVAARIAVDTARDPTSHNLWPFEIVIAGFVGAVAAGLGITIGALVRR
jgi:hypothetical protein